jgi:hypothetical protein
MPFGDLLFSFLGTIEPNVLPTAILGCSWLQPPVAHVFQKLVKFYWIKLVVDGKPRHWVSEDVGQSALHAEYFVCFRIFSVVDEDLLEASFAEGLMLLEKPWLDSDIGNSPVGFDLVQHVFLLPPPLIKMREKQRPGLVGHFVGLVI